MDYPDFFDPKKSFNLFGLNEHFDFLSKIYLKKKFPKVLMLTGLKGSGKSTLINHFLFSVFDKENYDNFKHKFSKSSNFYNQFKNEIFQNIIFLNGADYVSIKVDDIRNLKSKIFKSSILDKDRFIILNDIELFNINSLNALLKIIEEPSKNNYFILINNKSKPLINTIKSRTLEIKINLKENQRIEIIQKIVELNNIQNTLDPIQSKLTPGNYIKYNYICNEYGISPNNKFLDNLSLLLDLYKKKKDFLFIKLIFYLADLYFKNLKDKNIVSSENVFEMRNFVLDNLNKYLTFNLNHNSLINALNNRLNNG
jgi:DNA polymerase III subunit delta'